MLLGALARVIDFVLNMGLVFLLILQQPRLNWPYRGHLPAWEDARQTLFEGLRKVRADLDHSRQQMHPTHSSRDGRRSEQRPGRKQSPR